MPHQSKLSRSRPIHNAYSIASSTVLDFLVPAASRPTHSQPPFTHTSQKSEQHRNGVSRESRWIRKDPENLEHTFYSALLQVSKCGAHRQPLCQKSQRDKLHYRDSRRSFTTSLRSPQSEKSIKRVTRRKTAQDDQVLYGDVATTVQRKRSFMPSSSHSLPGSRSTGSEMDDTMRWLNEGHQKGDVDSTVRSWFPSNFFSNTFDKDFAHSSRLPPDFFQDIDDLRNILPPQDRLDEPKPASEVLSTNKTETTHENGNAVGDVREQAKLLKSVRDLEEKLAKAKKNLHSLMLGQTGNAFGTEDSGATTNATDKKGAVTLQKEDYMNLVDLYYYSHNSRFSPEATDSSPTPQFLKDFSFELSEQFSASSAVNKEALNEDAEYESPFQQINQKLKEMKSREIAVMQVFVDLLSNEHSSNRALYEAYKALPQPGVAHLPRGIVRLFLQRMSTPWTKSETSMLRYLSLIDDMQESGIPMTASEWSSAIYLAGRSFRRVVEDDVAAAFKIWRQMEVEAGVESSGVTFNILFDIAVRAGKFALGQTILMEMSKRGLRLNRLGRVSLIYYHGLRGDGDGVRKAYRDFVEAGEIVDTLVLNCVIASLMNAQEPMAAEQVYERMKSLYQRLEKKSNQDETESYFVQYPAPGEVTIGHEMAANHLGRALVRAHRLKEVLPEHHRELQASMPLIPDFVTFRTMLAYHATKSGDLDRITVLLHEMIEVFGVPTQHLVFQLLFKGFALHGPNGGPDGAWSEKRLNVCWEAFRQAVKETKARSRASGSSASTLFEPLLPPIRQVNAIPQNEPIPAFDPPLQNPPQRRLSGWHEFVLDLAVFPRERLRRIERFHSQMFDDENMKKPHEQKTPHTYVSPFFQSTIYQAPEPNLDHEEGEYVLPNPVDATITDPEIRPTNRPDDQMFPSGFFPDEMPSSSSPVSNASINDVDANYDVDQDFYQARSMKSEQSNAPDKHNHENNDNASEPSLQYHNQSHDANARTPPSRAFDNRDKESYQPSSSTSKDVIIPTRPLICWLLRAYAGITKSRPRVEEVWGAVRKMWNPKDQSEREAVVRVLRRCLRNCDRDSGRL